MSANVFTRHTITGDVKLRRLVKQGRKPSGLAAPRLYRLRQDSVDRFARMAEMMGEYWNENEFVRDAVARAVESVYTELVKT